LVKANEDSEEHLPIRTLFTSFRIDWLVSGGLLCAVFLEFATGDWSAIFTKERIGVSSGLAALPYIFFMIAMISGRLGANRLSQIFHIHHTVRFLSLVGGTGFIIFLAIAVNIPSEHKLSEANPSYRANIFVPEGGTSATALLSSTSGSIIQELPFSISLKKFHVEYYSTGMPKLFMSEVLIKDLDTGKETEAKIKVNEPMIHRGVAIYQSSFEDGGSKLKLRAYPMQGAANSVRSSFIVNGDVGQSTKLKSSDGTSYTLEFNGFRPTNVENISNASGQTDVRGVASQESDAGLKKLFSDRLGSAAKTSKPVDLKNVGPSVQYKLRDEAGQAREYSNYMQPLFIDEMPMFMLGVRQSSAEEFKYLRIPADANLSLNEWLTLRTLLQDQSARQRAVQRFIATIGQQSSFSGAPQMLTQLRESATRSIELFSGSTAFAVDQAKEAGIKPGGFAALGSFIDKAVPEAEQQKAAEVVLKVLNGVIWELWQEARAQLKLPPAKNDMESQRFIQAATSALSDVNFYPAPLVFQLDSFE
jgi:cytochrome c biogenesis protein